MSNVVFNKTGIELIFSALDIVAHDAMHDALLHMNAEMILDLMQNYPRHGRSNKLVQKWVKRTLQRAGLVSDDFDQGS